MDSRRSTRWCTRLSVGFVLIASLMLLSLLIAFPAQAFAQDSATSSSEVSTTSSKVDVCLIARMNAKLVAGQDGSPYQIDAQSAADAAGNCERICKAVIDSKRISVTLAISPLLLEFWQATDESGTQNGEAALSALEDAISTGRLELVDLGYSDPDLVALSTAGFADDITRQYDMSASTVTEQLSTGTVPANLSFQDDLASILTNSGITWTAVDASAIDAGDNSRISGIFLCRSEHNLYLVGVDTTNSALFCSNDITSASTFLGSLPSQPGLLADNTYASLVTIDSSAQASAFCRILSAASGISNIGLSTVSSATQAANEARNAPPLASVTSNEGARSIYSVDYLEALSRAQSQVRTLRGMLYSSNTTYDTAQSLLLVSESSCFSDDATSTVCANTAAKTAGDFLDGISIKLEDMVLAGNSGSIPFTVYNNTDAALEVTITFTPSNGVEITDDTMANGYSTVLYSGENAFEVPVSCSGDKGRLSVSIMSGTMTVEQVSSAVSTSHINDVTIVVCIVLVIGGILIYAHRKRRRKKVADAVESEDKEKDA